ncbi:hypothetical protein D3C85_1000950 [compost metagenome]
MLIPHPRRIAPFLLRDHVGNAHLGQVFGQHVKVDVQQIVQHRHLLERACCASQPVIGIGDRHVNALGFAQALMAADVALKAIQCTGGEGFLHQQHPAIGERQRQHRQQWHQQQQWQPLVHRRQRQMAEIKQQHQQHRKPHQRSGAFVEVAKEQRHP